MRRRLPEEQESKIAPALCEVEDCGDRVKVRKLGLCNKHYLKFRRYGNPTAGRDYARDRRTNKGKTCSVEGCERWATTKRMCNMHYTRWYKWGDPHFTKFSRRESGYTNTVCRWEGCQREVSVHGLCRSHYGVARYSRKHEHLIPEENRAKRCEVDKCPNPVYAKGLCKHHVGKKTRSGGDPHGRLMPGRRGVEVDDGVYLCVVTGCIEKSLAMGFCRRHYDSHIRNSDPERIRRRVSKAIQELERLAFAPELWPKGKRPEDIRWLIRSEQVSGKASGQVS